MGHVSPLGSGVQGPGRFILVKGITNATQCSRGELQGSMGHNYEFGGVSRQGEIRKTVKTGEAVVALE